MSVFRERVRELETVIDDHEDRGALGAIMAGALRRVAEPAVAAALFEACDALSGEAYEGAETTGALLLAPRGHPSIDLVLEMAEATPLRATRAARKTLELSRGEIAPLSDGAAVWALGRVARPYDAGREDLFEVRFAGRGRWELRHAGEVLFAVARPRPPRPAPVLARSAFEAAARAALAASAPELPRLWEAVAAVVATARGSTVVVSADAAAEARRLAAQGTRIAPRRLEPEVVQAATGIGGAMLLDPAGVCHAIGAILDGVATPHGARSRGSRFNSAANYVRGRPGALAVVVSDDGSVDLLAG